MRKAIKVTNVFTGVETIYDGVDALREDAASILHDGSATGLVNMLADAYAQGRPTGTYEWLLGVKVADVDIVFHPCVL